MEDLWHATYVATQESPKLAVLAAEFLAEKVVYLLPGFFVALWIKGTAQTRRSVLEAGVVVCAAIALNLIVRTVWPQPRPFAIGLSRQWVEHASNSSFPSNHATFLLAAGLAFLSSRQWMPGLATLITAAAVGIARVYLGLHYPSDLAGSIATSSVAVVLVRPIWDRYGDLIQTALEANYARIISRLISAVRFKR